MKPYIDIHCHPSIKPFGLACPGNINNIDATHRNSIWHDDPPTSFDKTSNDILMVTRFSQSNFTALHQGNFGVIIAALNPIEKGFFTSKLGSDNIANSIYNFATGIGRKKIDFIQQNKDDFNELCCEYDFYKQLHDTKVKIYGQDIRYRLTSNSNDINNNHNAHEEVLFVVLSIEGGYTLNNDNSKPPDRILVLSNIDKIKQWEYPPFFVTLCHHFYNYLGGHARSLPSGLVNKNIDQTQGIDTDISPLGTEVIHHLLNNTNNRRIYIDIKHMSRKVRISYYNILETAYHNEQIPIIVSHGAVNGYPKVDDFSSPQKDRHGKFLGRDINFYDDEIVRIAKSGGIFGLQIDKRQITNKCESRKIRYLCFTKKRKLWRWTGLVWNQIQYIADLLDKNGLPAWDITCLGTDYDGMVSPIRGYWTSADIKDLYPRLLKYADKYQSKKNFVVSTNNLLPNVILDKIFSENALSFLSKYY